MRMLSPFLKAQPRSQSYPRVKAPTDEQELIDVLLHVRVPSLCTIYIDFVAFKVTID